MRRHAETDPRIRLSVVDTSPKQRSVDGRSLWDRVAVSGLGAISQACQLVRIASGDNIDVVHHTTSGQLAIFRDILLLLTSRLLRIPTVYHLHFGRVPDLAKASSIEWKMLLVAMSLASTVIAIDQRTSEAVKRHAPNISISEIPNPIDPETLPTAVSGTRNRVVFLGWVTKAKGVEDLLTAWGSVHEIFIDWTLTIVGPSTPNYRSRLEQSFATAGVQFLGELDHDFALEQLAAADIVILPSHTEGFPFSVLEAMAIGKPVIACDVGAIPSMLDGGCGVLIQPKSPESIDRALKDLMSDGEVRHVMANMARKRAERYYIDIVFEQYLNLWQQLSLVHDRRFKR